MENHLSLSETIDGFQVESVQFKPLEIYKLGPRVAKIYLPIMQLGSVKDMTAIDFRRFTPVVCEILDQLGAKENANLPVELLARTTVYKRNEKGERLAFQLTSASDIDDAFQGKFRSMLMVMWEVIKFNFADFFPGDGASAPTKG